MATFLVIVLFASVASIAWLALAAVAAVLVAGARRDDGIVRLR